MRQAEIKINGQIAGNLWQDEEGYHFVYDLAYISSGKNPLPVSLTMPIQKEPFVSNTLFAFFDGLIPEGWLLEIAEKNWKLNPRDRMGLLLSCCNDCIGAVSVHPIQK